MGKKRTGAAVRSGAESDYDFALYAHVVSLRDGFRNLKPPPGLPPALIPRTEGIVARYDYFLSRGRFFRPQPLPKGFRRGKAKQCYGNSYRLAVRDESLTYCEGFVSVPVGDRLDAIEHGWCVSADGQVLDVTLPEIGLAYFGVPYTPEELAGVDEVPVVDNIIAARIREGKVGGVPPAGRRAK